MTLYTFEKFNTYAEITGYKNICPIQATTYLKNNRKTDPKNTWIQFYNPYLIATHTHLYFAILNTLYAFKNNTNTSKNPAIETLLYTSTQHQIEKAIQTIGLNPNITDMAVTIISNNTQQIKNTLNDLTNNLQTQPNEDVLNLTPEKTRQIKQTYNITSTMIKTTTKNKEKEENNSALINLIIEKMALQATKT